MAESQYSEVAAKLREAIRSGTYQHGDMLPTEAQLAAELGVNRATVNKALRMLRSEGLIYVHRGVGTFVHRLPPILRDAATRHQRERRERHGSRGALAAELTELGYELESTVEVSRAVPPPLVADVLGVSGENESVVLRARRFHANRVPIQIVNSYIPLAIAADTPIEQIDTGVGGLSSRLADLGHAQAEIEESITVRLPTADEAEFLQIADDQRVYEIFHVGLTAKDVPVKTTIYIMPVHQWNLRYRYPVDSTAQ